MRCCAGEWTSRSLAQRTASRTARSTSTTSSQIKAWTQTRLKARTMQLEQRHKGRQRKRQLVGSRQQGTLLQGLNVVP